jgi:hypothetical protein
LAIINVSTADLAPNSTSEGKFSSESLILALTLQLAVTGTFAKKVNKFVTMVIRLAALLFLHKHNFKNLIKHKNIGINYEST